MLQITKPLVCWGIGLSANQESRLQECLGEDLSLSAWPADHVPTLHEMENTDPCLLWLSPMGQKSLQERPKNQTRHLELLPTVLLLGEDYSLTDYEDACDIGITEIIRPPFTPKRAKEVMRRALEAQTIHHDMLCMTREIMLERELLERKNDLLHFLVNFLTNTSGSLCLEHILHSAFQGLGLLLPVRALHAAVWQVLPDKEPEVTLHISAPEDSEPFALWQKNLLEQTRVFLGKRFQVLGIQPLMLAGQDEGWKGAPPQEGHTIVLPIATATEKVGVLLLQTEMERSFGRDQVMALESAMRHLALTVKNAQRLSMAQLHADFDSLTRIHSRRHFESRLAEEMDRFSRYGQPLSMIMLDIDHFKQVNDTRGHHVGDSVLREVAGIIMKTVRNSDYCARYGGEEFAVLLPHTDRKNAVALAERLRKAIAGHAFVAEGIPLSITASLGISSLIPGSVKNGLDLIREADSALYSAKAEGRNCSRVGGVCLQMHSEAAG